MERRSRESPARLAGFTCALLTLAALASVALLLPLLLGSCLMETRG